MCGIVFAAGELKLIHKRAFLQLLTVDQLRGEDSTGIAFISTEKHRVDIAKELGTPDYLMYSKRANKLIDADNCVLIGHNRYATVGGVTRDTAHPFEFANVVGVHNGTLQSKWRLERHMDFKVDSEALYSHISDNGIDDAISLLGAPNNAWSLVYWDKKEEALKLLRNTERPMFVTWAADNSVMFGASEDWMLYSILGRNGIKHGEVLPTALDMLYTIEIDKKGVLQKPSVRRVAAIPPAPPANFYPPNTTTHGKAGNKKSSLVLVEDAKTKAKNLPDYVCSEIRQFEILGKRRATFGGNFLSLLDRKNPAFHIRMYYNGNRNIDFLVDMVGADITTKIIAYRKDPDTQEDYFIACPNSVFLVPDEEYFADAKGTLIPRTEWEKKYIQCDFCGTNLVAGTGVAFSRNYTECFCANCAKSPDVQDLINMA